MPDPLEFKINDLTIIFTFSMDILGDDFVDFHLKQRAFLEIIPSSPLHFNVFQSDIIYIIRNFLSLGTGAAVVPLVIKGRRKECTSEIRAGEKIPQDILMYYPAKGFSVNDSKRERRNMLFHYVDIAESFQNILQKWFDKTAIMLPVLDLYFGILYIPTMYVHLEFLTLAQSLETYHSRMKGGSYLSSDDYKPIRDKLVEAIPAIVTDEHRQSLIGTLSFGYQFSLRQRIKRILRDVLQPYQAIVDQFIPNQGEFIDQLVNTRNYLTHYSPESEARAVTEPVEQKILVEKMKLIMQLCFFIELELPPDMVMNLVMNNDNFQRWGVSKT